MAIIKYRKGVKPAGVAFAKELPEFADFFTNTLPTKIESIDPNLAAPQFDQTVPTVDEEGNDVEMLMLYFDTVEHMQSIEDAQKLVVPDAIKTYNQENGIKFYAKIVDQDTGAVITDWYEL